MLPRDGSRKARQLRKLLIYGSYSTAGKDYALGTPATFHSINFLMLVERLTKGGLEVWERSSVAVIICLCSLTKVNLICIQHQQIMHLLKVGVSTDVIIWRCYAGETLSMSMSRYWNYQMFTFPPQPNAMGEQIFELRILIRNESTRTQDDI